MQLPLHFHWVENWGRSALFLAAIIMEWSKRDNKKNWNVSPSWNRWRSWGVTRKGGLNLPSRWPADVSRTALESTCLSGENINNKEKKKRKEREGLAGILAIIFAGAFRFPSIQCEHRQRSLHWRRSYSPSFEKQRAAHTDGPTVGCTVPYYN